MTASTSKKSTQDLYQDLQITRQSIKKQIREKESPLLTQSADGEKLTTLAEINKLTWCLQQLELFMADLVKRPHPLEPNPVYRQVKLAEYKLLKAQQQSFCNYMPTSALIHANFHPLDGIEITSQSLTIRWLRRGLFALSLAATAAAVIGLTLLLLAPIAAIAALKTTLILGVVALGALFGLCHPAMAHTQIQIAGTTMSVATPVAASLAPVVQAIMVPYLLRTKLASLTVMPKKEMQARRRHDVIFQQRLWRSMGKVEQAVQFEDSAKKQLQSALGESQRLLHCANTSIFEEKRQASLKKAQLILRVVLALVDKQALESNQLEVSISLAGAAEVKNAPGILAPTTTETTLEKALKTNRSTFFPRRTPTAYASVVNAMNLHNA